MSDTPSKSTSEEIDKELEKLGYKKQQVKVILPIWARIVLACIKHWVKTGDLPWWAVWYVRTRYGKFSSCFGTEFTGIRFTDGTPFNPADARFINHIRPTGIYKEASDYTDSEGRKHFLSGESKGS